MKLIEWIKSLFQPKSPCCNVGIHEHWGGNNSIVYECSNCKKQWI